MYQLTEEKKVVENKEYTVYGIRYDDEYSVDDVAADKAEVERMVELFNSSGLAPYQLYDAVCDITDGGF